ncbi:MAG: 1-deoxy-D-xylulose-5-phosphate synthase [bacterium]|nr:1-deoxy-D-xylulose-5-phosphate synthase [bacterium]
MTATSNTPEPLLPRISSPADLRSLPLERLPQLCHEIRQFLIENVPKTGGHFASNLGTVELAVALHYVFDTPRDDLVWDTGHQAYAHKLLTGRLHLFHTIRQYRGISGYPTPEESPYDVFPVGHAGTSISIALGLAKARDLSHGSQHIIAVIGDGGLTSGLALEGLNNAHGVRKFLVVLNDNKMSISPTIGALARHFSRVVSDRRYRYLKREIGSFLLKIPLVGRWLTTAIQRVQGGIKHIIAPQNVFENLGFHYLGPINGHDIHQLVSFLQACRDETDMPVLLHVLTRKGKGYSPAEGDPERFHGLLPTSPACNGELPLEGETYTDIFADALHECARHDPRIVVISAAMCAGMGLTRFAQEHPERFVDVGIAEQHAVTFAAGLAARGLRPVVGIYSTFLQRAYDQIAHDVCLPHVPVALAIDRAGLVGGDGKTHHGVFDIAYLRHLPGMHIFMPRDRSAMHSILRYIFQQTHPSAIRYPRCIVPNSLVPGGLPPFSQLEPTRWQLLSSGSDCAIIALGHMVFNAYRAAQLLAAQGIHATVVDACSVWPLDLTTLAHLATSCASLITIEDHVLAGGFGSAVAEYLAQHSPTPPLLTIGIPNRFVEHGSLQDLYRELGWLPDQLAHRISAWLRNPHASTCNS